MENENYELLEAVADIAFIAGENKYYSGNSRDDISNIILWAKEFEDKYKDVNWGEDIDYIDTIYAFAIGKINSK